MFKKTVFQKKEINRFCSIFIHLSSIKKHYGKQKQRESNTDAQSRKLHP